MSFLSSAFIYTFSEPNSSAPDNFMSFPISSIEFIFWLQGQVGHFVFKLNVIYVDNLWNWLAMDLLVWTVQTVTLVKLQWKKVGENFRSEDGINVPLHYLPLKQKQKD